MENPIGRFKLPYSRSVPIHKLEKWIDESNTKESEKAIGHLFIKYLRDFENKKVLYFSPNENDGNKNPDLHFHIEGKIVGVQITQFVLNNYLSKFNQAKNICEYISNETLKSYKPDIKINVQIFTPFADTDKVPFGQKTSFKKLSKLIGETIKENIEHLKAKNEYLNFNIKEAKIRDVAGHFSLYPVPNEFHSNYFGNDKIFVDYGFDNVFIYPQDIDNSVNKIYDSKNGGNSEVLLIWGDERHFMDTEIKIIETLKKRFTNNTTFSKVYFMTFNNILHFGDKDIHVDRIV